MKKSFWKTALTSVLLLMCVGCAGMQRGCSNFGAEQFGSDWVVVQFDCSGQPMNAWQLKNTSITNESGSDGIYWQDGTTSHLVHISGWYNRVQVEGGRYEEAAKLLGVELEKIGNGKYPK